VRASITSSDDANGARIFFVPSRTSIGNFSQTLGKVRTLWIGGGHGTCIYRPLKR
jgi:hypothetical protein